MTSIDEKKGLVTFNNHGIVQELPLANAPTLTTPTPVSVPAPGLNTAIPAVMPNNTGGNNPRKQRQQLWWTQPRFEFKESPNAHLST